MGVHKPAQKDKVEIVRVMWWLKEQVSLKSYFGCLDFDHFTTTCTNQYDRSTEFRMFGKRTIPSQIALEIHDTSCTTVVGIRYKNQIIWLNKVDTNQLNHCGAPQDLLSQTIWESTENVAVITTVWRYVGEEYRSTYLTTSLVRWMVGWS